MSYLRCKPFWKKDFNIVFLLFLGIHEFKGPKVKNVTYAAHLPPALGQWVSRKKEKGFGGGARWFVKEEEEEEEREAPLGILQGRWREEEEEGGSVHGGGGLLWRKEKTAWREGGRNRVDSLRLWP